MGESRRHAALLAGAVGLVAILVAIAAAFGRGPLDDALGVPTPGATPLVSETATASPSSSPGGRIVTLYHGDTDEVAEQRDGTTVVCDFHVRGTVFDYRAGNEYRLEPIPPFTGTGAYVGAQHSSNEQGEWRSEVISIPEGKWRLTILGTLFHPEQTRMVTVQCPGGRTPVPTPVATPTPTPFPAALVTGAVEAFPLGPLSGEIAWTIATDPHSLSATVHAVPLDGSPTRPTVRYEAPREGPARDSNELGRQLSLDGRTLVLSVGVGSPPVYDLVLVDLETGAVRPLTRTSHLDELYPAWSPDGSRIAFTRGSDGAWEAEIWVMNSDGSGERRIRQGRQGGPTQVYGWTPDSRAVGYEAIGFEDSMYEGYDLTTGAVWSAGRTFLGGDWRPGRPMFVAGFYDNPRVPQTSELRVADEFGQAMRVIARASIDPANQQPGAFTRPRWHPARDLVLTIQQAAFSVISVFPLDGGEPVRLGTGRPYLAEWAPDGDRIVYVTPRTGTGPSAVRVQRLDGTLEADPDNSPFVAGREIRDLAVRLY